MLFVLVSLATLLSDCGAGRTPLEDKRLVVLASGLNQPVGIALASGYVYWLEPGIWAVRRPGIAGVPVMGGGVTGEPAGIDLGAAAFTIYGDEFYWTSIPSGAATASVKGQPFTVLATGFVNDTIAVSADGIFGTGAVAGGTTIVRAPLAGGAAGALVPASDLTQPFAAHGIAVDASYVYWVSAGDPCTVGKVGLAGGTPITLAQVSGAGFGLALDATSVYWTSSAAVWSVPKGGGQAVQLATPGGQGIAVDESNAYWTATDGTVDKVPIQGGPVTALARAQARPDAIAVDASSVYWVDRGDGQQDGAVMKFTPK